jgi:uncharacterized protein DUF3108
MSSHLRICTSPKPPDLIPFKEAQHTELHRHGKIGGRIRFHYFPMHQSWPLRFLILLFLCSLPSDPNLVPAERSSVQTVEFPSPEKLHYRIEWRLITAGSAAVDMTQSASEGWEIGLNLESAGLVTKLYKVLDTYKVLTDRKFCGASTYLDAQEGKRHLITRLVFDNARRKAQYEERDLIKNTSLRKELDIAPCTHEITGALLALRGLNLDPGKSTYLSVTDGKKLANARIECQAREALTVGGRDYQTLRYEAFLFDNVLYRRRGRLLVWITDGLDRTPVQIRLQMGFPIGNVTVQLDNQRSS